MNNKYTHVGKKDSFYFSHDSNAKDDPKCVLLIEQLGLEGYGIFWILVETLREQPDFKYPLILVSALARRYNTTAEKMRTVISSYQLFCIEDDTFFFSESLNRRMAIYLDKKRRLSEAGRKGGLAKRLSSNKDNEANLKHGLSDAQANKEKEIKGKETTLFESQSREKNDLLESFPPNDGISRNWEGLKRNLENLKGEIADKNRIIQLSNYGEINHPVWKLLKEVQNSNGRIYSPLSFLISRLET